MSHRYRHTVISGLSDARLTIEQSTAATLQERLGAASRPLSGLVEADFRDGEDRSRFVSIRNAVRRAEELSETEVKDTLISLAILEKTTIENRAHRRADNDPEYAEHD